MTSKTEMSHAMQQIFIIEDEKDILDLLVFNLEKAGYRVLTETDGDAGLKKIIIKTPDLIILDLMLPTLDGISICKVLKANPKTARIPILMLTAKNEESDKIVGLELGADDYMTKPFSVKELVARIRVILRRFQQAQDKLPVQVFKELILDRYKHQVTLHQKKLQLTAKEFELLDYFLTHEGRVLSRDVLLNSIWGYDYFGTTRTVDVHVRRLREKVKQYASYIKTVKGYGYLFESETR
jgi:two-component system alkaline phosphatase synthesis response regulator PhoP